MIEEEWYCTSCAGYFDRLAPEEGKTCAFCGSKYIHLVDDHGGIIQEPKCFLTEAPSEKCNCILYNICMRYKDSIITSERRTPE